MATSVPPRFCTDYAKRVAKCQKCKMQLEKGVLRMGKIMPNFFVAAKDPSKPPPDMKQYFHKECLFEMLFKARPTTKVIDETEEIEGFEDLNAEDQDEIKKLVDELTEKRSKDGPAEPKKTPSKKKSESKEEVEETPSRKRKNYEPAKSKRPTEFNEESDYNSFYKFLKVCSVMKDISSSSEKSAVITSMLQKKGFDGDLMLWLSFLIRESDKRDYNVTDEKLVSYFVKILDTDEAKILKYISKSNDVALSIAHAHEKKVTNEKSNWSLQKVDRFLEKLETLKEDDEIVKHLKFAAKRFRHDELEVLIRLIRKELDTGATATVVLKGVHSTAPNIFESDGLDKVVDKYYNNGFEDSKKSTSSKKSEPKAKKTKREEGSDESDAEESEVEMSDSESEGEGDSDSDTGEEEEDISGSDSDDVSEISSDEGDEVKENSPKKVARGTRTRPRGSNGNIVKKEECPPNMEACRYGEKCYRKNKQHLEQFWHPSSQ
ncbi:hypothetical protein L3Y34_017682 [Caenorhabditis briggsae]|uniref:PARP-type domain-containing protein n=2 Tax=Caenorhabditis briggsae TaxID=6238 RepID=A0AAE9DJM8_CAEBR|nr:hypothetical protein L3Y34_017682 [Caenorhabditis briggsae]